MTVSTDPQQADLLLIGIVDDGYVSLAIKTMGG